MVKSRGCYAREEKLPFKLFPPKVRLWMHVWRLSRVTQIAKSTQLYRVTITNITCSNGPLK
jgi:hypothetical protein